MGEFRARYRALHSHETGPALDRVVFFSDAVFAIAMTVLVIDIRIPEGVSTAEGVLDVLPQILAYVISFYVIAANWVAHHRKFTAIEAVDATLIWLNLVLLMLIAFVPFPTSLLSNGKETSVVAVVLYAAVVAATSLVQLAMWVYAWRRGLIDSHRIDRGLYLLSVVNILVVPAVFTLSIPVALLAGPARGQYSWLVLIPVSILAARWEPRRARGLSRSRG